MNTIIKFIRNDFKCKYNARTWRAVVCAMV
jgi:hypothetical protein